MEILFYRVDCIDDSRPFETGHHLSDCSGMVTMTGEYKETSISIIMRLESKLIILWKLQWTFLL